MKKRKLKLFFIITGTVLGLFFVSVGGYAAYLYYSVKETAHDVYKPLGTNENDLVPLKSRKNEDSKKSTGPASINVLLLGVDERTGDKGRSDTMIVATLNPKKNTLEMTSIPRDTRVHIEGRSGYSKINAAYAYGDEALAVKTVSKYLDIPIDYYVKINMEGLSSLVDAVGGVSVNNDIEWTSGDFTYKKGMLQLNGDKALGYARMRHDDPRGDFGRNMRQRQVIESVINKEKSFTAIADIKSILNTVGNNVQTNLTFNDMKYLAKNYRNCRQNITDYEVKGTPKYLDGVSWVLVSDEELKNVHDRIVKALKG